MLYRLAAATAEDKRFITLLRHAHVLPFAPLPSTSTDADPAGRDTMYAVLQPVDHISAVVLEDIALAHADRAARRAPAAQHTASENPGGNTGLQRQGSGVRADQPAGAAPPADDGAQAAAEGQPAKRQRTQEDDAAAPATQDPRPAPQAASAKGAGAGSAQRPDPSVAFTVR